MDVQAQSEPEFTLVSTANNAESAQYSGAFFPGSSGFTIRGGKFTSNVTHNVYNPSKEQPSAFRTVLLGDINLMKEIRSSEESGVVGRQRRGPYVRRMYSAKLEGRKSGRVTVAIYQGDSAEEEWRKHVAKYESIRHPHIMQLYGLVSTRGLCAMVFHNELIPFTQFLNRFRHSTILTTYVQGYCSTEWNEASAYLGDIHGISWTNWSAWIRTPTGELCVELIEDEEKKNNLFWWHIHDGRHLKDVSLNDPDAEALVISTLNEDKYHKLCSGYPIARFQILSVSTQLPVGPGSIIGVNPQDWSCSNITEPLALDHENPIWWGVGDEVEVLPNSWTRYDSGQVRNLELKIPVWPESEIHKFWLGQANYIFSQLKAKSPTEDFVCVDSIEFTLKFQPTACNPHQSRLGYLFVCPPDDFRTGRNLFRWPECPAYWSLDPSGPTRLSTEDAKILGFPIIHIETHIGGYFWNTSVYDGLRQFHRGKGFDPESQEVAKHLGYPLFKVLSIANAPLPYERRAFCSPQNVVHCQKLGHYVGNPKKPSAPHVVSTSPASPSPEDAPLGPSIPSSPAKCTRLFPNTALFSSPIFLVLGIIFALRLLPTVA